MRKALVITFTLLGFPALADISGEAVGALIGYFVLLLLFHLALVGLVIARLVIRKPKLSFGVYVIGGILIVLSLYILSSQGVSDGLHQLFLNDLLFLAACLVPVIILDIRAAKKKSGRQEVTPPSDNP